jgi:mannose/fructose/N-acetylgalactosamine-specific phosphotransferase system component IIC
MAPAGESGAATEERGLPRGPGPGTARLACLVLAAIGLLALVLAVAQAGAPGPLPLGPGACLGLALWAALVFAGSRALSPLGFDEPLVAGLVAGAVIGRLPEGLVAGVTFQIVWPGVAPMGGSREPSAGLAAVVMTVWMALLPAALAAWRIPFAFAAGLGASAWGIAVEGVLRQRNERRVDRVLAGPAGSWAERAAAGLNAGLAEAALAGIAAAALLAAIPAVAASVLARDGATAASGAARSWLLGLPAWGVTPLLCFALGGRVRVALAPWRLRGRGSEPGPRTATGAGVTGAPCLGLGRFGRLLSLQAGFSDRHRQRPAFMALMARRGTDAPGPEAELRQAIAAGPPPNTHPVMAAALVGALDRTLRDASAGEAPRPSARLLDVGGTQLAHWGDRMIWGALRPAWAMLALIVAPLAGPVTALVFAAGALLASLASRPALYRWGWKSGWDLVRGGAGRLWRQGPLWVERAHLPLLAAVTVVTAGVWLVRGPGASATGLRAIWFILGLLLGATARHPAAWGWVAGVAAGVGAALDLWRSQAGL